MDTVSDRKKRTESLKDSKNNIYKTEVLPFHWGNWRKQRCDLLELFASLAGGLWHGDASLTWQTGTVSQGCQRFTGQIGDELIECRQLSRMSVPQICWSRELPMKGLYLVWSVLGEFYLLTLKVSGCRIIASVHRQPWADTVSSHSYTHSRKQELDPCLSSLICLQGTLKVQSANLSWDALTHTILSTEWWFLGKELDTKCAVFSVTLSLTVFRRLGKMQKLSS